MAQEQEPQGKPPSRPKASGRKVEFNADRAFQDELRRRADEYFQSTGQSRRDCWRMYLKTAILLAWFAASYVLLVFVARTPWQALPLALLLALAAAGIGFNIQHDGGHKAYSNRPWVNRLMAMTLDVIGGSSHVWRWKHAVIHHTYVNITGLDTDIDVGILGRLTPHQKRRALHRWQHLYLWPLYGLLAVKWHLRDDFQNVLTGRIGPHTFPRPRGWDLVVFIAGKGVFLALAFGIPLLVHPLWVVLLYYAVVAVMLGMVISVVFQLAHCVEEAAFPLPREDTGRMEDPWAVHQVKATADFAPRSRILTWYLGGLNFQTEHHLFATTCHLAYPALAKLVEETCRDFGVRYAVHPSLLGAVASHFRWLRRMGLPSATA